MIGDGWGMNAAEVDAKPTRTEKKTKIPIMLVFLSYNDVDLKEFCFICGNLCFVFIPKRYNHHDLISSLCVSD